MKANQKAAGRYSMAANYAAGRRDRPATAAQGRAGPGQARDARPDISFPVLRVGRLISTANAQGEPRVLDFDEGERAIQQFVAAPERFDQALRTVLSERGCLIVPAPEGLVLAPPKRSSAFGAVFDFAEHAFTTPSGATCLARLCATVCVVEPFGDIVVTSLPKVYSKLWIRIILASHPESDVLQHRALNLAPNLVASFQQECLQLGDAILESAMEPYREVISGATNEKLTTSLGDRLSVLACGDNRSSFDHALESLQVGERLSCLLEQNNQTAETLMDVACGVYAPAAEVTSGERRKLLDDEEIDLQVYAAAGVKGIFLSQMKRTEGGPSTADFVGLAFSRTEAAIQQVWSAKRPLRLGHCSANVATAHVVAELGSYF